MSDLVMKVKAAIEEVPWVDMYVNDSKGEARAAIKAVAEWLDERDNDGRYWATVLIEQLEGSE